MNTCVPYDQNSCLIFIAECILFRTSLLGFFFLAQISIFPVVYMPLHFKQNSFYTVETLESEFKKNHLFLFSVYYECFACFSMCPFGAHEGKKRVLNSLELLGATLWVLGPKPGSCARSSSILTTVPSFQPLELDSKIIFVFYVHVLLLKCLHHVCAWGLWRPEEHVGYLGTGVTCKLPCRFWESNQDSVLLTTEPLLQTWRWIFKNLCDCFRVFFYFINLLPDYSLQSFSIVISFLVLC